MTNIEVLEQMVSEGIVDVSVGQDVQSDEIYEVGIELTNGNIVVLNAHGMRLNIEVEN